MQNTTANTDALRAPVFAALCVLDFMDTNLVFVIALTLLSVFSVLAMLFMYFSQPKKERLLGEHKVSRSRISAFLFLVLGGAHLFQWYSGAANQFTLYIGTPFLLFGIFQLIKSISEKNT